MGATLLGTAPRVIEGSSWSSSILLMFIGCAGFCITGAGATLRAAGVGCLGGGTYLGTLLIYSCCWRWGRLGFASMTLENENGGISVGRGIARDAGGGGGGTGTEIGGRAGGIFMRGAGGGAGITRLTIEAACTGRGGA